MDEQLQRALRDAFERERLANPSREASAWQQARQGPPAPSVGGDGVISRMASGMGKAGRWVGRGVVSTAGLQQLSKGVNQITGDQPGGKIEGAGRLAAGAAAVGSGVVPKLMGVAGPVGAAASGSLALTDAMGLPWYGLSPAALAQRGVDAAMNNDTVRSGVNTVRRALGLPTDDRPSTTPPPTAAPAAQPAAPAAPAAAPAATGGPASWFDSPQAAVSNVARQRPAGPIARAAGAPSRFAQERVGQLQQMAVPSQEIARPPVAEVTAPMEVYGPSVDGSTPYAGATQVGSGVYELPAWDGPAPNAGVPEGQVLIDRGGGQNVIQSFADAQKGGTERVAFMPELKGLEPTQLAEFINNSAGSSDPRLIAANKQAAEMLKESMGVTGAQERQRLANEGGLAQQQEATRGTLGAANIRAKVEREDMARRGPGTVMSEEPVANADGTVDPYAATRKTPFVWDQKSEQYRPIANKVQQQLVPQKDFDQAVAAYRKAHPRATQQQAVAAVGTRYRTQ